MLSNYQGLIFIGDPHLASQTPGFRKDDYKTAILKKLEYALDYALEHQLLPVLLGDLFHWPRNSAISLLTQLMRLLDNRFVLSVTGNHDTTERELKDDDSLAVLSAAGRIYLLDQKGPWKGQINNIPVQIGGTSWSSPLPKTIEDTENESLVIWVTHHNICFAGTEEMWVKPREIPGIHLVVNGHLHRPAPAQRHGMTTWMNPGNISRVQRADIVREAIPSILKIVPQENLSWTTEIVPLPHEPFDQVFHASLEDVIFKPTDGRSAFIQGLETIESTRTSGGAGLISFINSNIGQFEKEVADIILNLVKEVCPNES